MLRILLATTRQATFRSFVDGLFSDRDVRLEMAPSKSDVLDAAHDNPPHLAVIDSELPDVEPLSLVSELLVVNAAINTAVISSLSDKDFHDAYEGLGVLGRLPVVPDENDAKNLLQKLRAVLGATA